MWLAINRPAAAGTKEMLAGIVFEFGFGCDN